MRCILMLATVLVLLACAPARLGNRIQAGGSTVDGEIVRAAVVVTASSPHNDDQLFIVSCPRSAAGGVQPDQCWWQAVGQPGDAPAPTTPEGVAVVARARRASQALQMASALHGCPRERIEVQSDGTREGVEGYWLLVCGAQRFMQWDAAQNRFVDRTPAP